MAAAASHQSMCPRARKQLNERLMKCEECALFNYNRLAIRVAVIQQSLDVILCSHVVRARVVRRPVVTIRILPLDGACHAHPSVLHPLTVPPHTQGGQ